MTEKSEFVAGLLKSQEDDRAVKFDTGIVSEVVTEEQAKTLVGAGAVLASTLVASEGIDRSFKVSGHHSKDNLDWVQGPNAEYRSRGLFLSYEGKDQLQWVMEVKGKELDTNIGSFLTFKTVWVKPGTVTLRIHTETGVITKTEYKKGGYVLSNNTAFGHTSSNQELYLESLGVSKKEGVEAVKAER